MLALGALTLGAAGHASAGTLSPTLLQKARAGDQTPIGVIVRFNIPNTGQGRALYKNLRGQLNSQIAKLGPQAGFLRQALNDGKVTQLWLDQSIYLPMTPVQARAISLLPFVSDVFENFRVQVPRAVALSSASAPAGTPWHLQNIGAPSAWAAGFKGQGIRIGHLDSGVDPNHPDLQGKVVAFQEFNGEGDRVAGQARDTTDHGTHTAGLLVGSKTGVAPDAKIISALVLPNNEGTFAQVIAGMQYVLDPDNNADTNDGAQVVNMSLGIPGTWDEFIVPVENMLKAGVVPVFAIGNFGPASGSTGSPGNLPDAIGVGAVDQNNQVASFSSRGPVAWQGKINGVFTKPDIAAPGSAITSTYPNGAYGSKSGSSQASPIVAGAVAVMLSAKPGSGVDAIKNALYTTASNAGAKNNNVGFGVISLPAALNKLGASVTTQPAPTQPAPSQPAPTQPAPTQPAPTQPAPTQPAPTQPAPSQPAPTQPAPTPPAAQPTGPAGFTFCALEGGICTGAQGKQAAFGAAGRYVYGTSTAPTFACTTTEWGQDPAPGQAKACFVQGTAPAPTPTPAQPTPTQPSQPAPSGNVTKPTVLLVDDDMGQGADVTAALRDAIRTNSASALVWNTQTQGPVPLTQLQRAQVVVWATGEQYQNTLTAQDQQVLGQYLRGGGKLLITGQDVGYDIGQTAFYTGLLKTRFVADSSGQSSLVTSGAFGNTRFTLNADGSAKNQVYPDVIADLNGSATVAGWGTAGATANTISAQSVAPDNNRARAAQKRAQPRRVQALSASENAGAIVVNDAGTYRTVNMGFGLEGLTPNSRNILVKTAFDWLMR